VSTRKKKGRGNIRVGYLVKWVERGLRARMDAALEPHGLTTPEYTALSVLNRRDGLSSAQLARRTLVTAQAMNQVVIRLETRRLIERTPDPEHARRQQIVLTARGKALLEASDRATAAIEAQMLAALSGPQVEALRKALEACVAALGEVEAS
jgi:DNA-binding MarR family transcriptional regulator